MTPLRAHVTEPLTRQLNLRIEAASASLRHDMEMRRLAARQGDRLAVEAFEFRMRETYGELLPRLVVAGLIGLWPHLAVLCLLYWFLPELTLPGEVTVSTVSAYIVVGVLLLVSRHVRRWRAVNDTDTGQTTGTTP